MLRFLLLTCALLLPHQLRAEGQPIKDYVRDNTIAIFHHELGHALIDVLAIPIFGQEEDAADVLSILMLDSLFDEETADAIAYNTALTFEADAIEAEDNGQQLAYWDTHGLDLQRYYNVVCLHYGGNPDAREEFAEELGLPQERAETCEEELELAEDSWGPVLDELDKQGKGKPNIKLQIATPKGEIEEIYTQTVVEEVEALNQWMRLPTDLVVSTERCGEANAFYDLSDRKLTFCLEFAEHLKNQAESF